MAAVRLCGAFVAAPRCMRAARRIQSKSNALPTRISCRRLQLSRIHSSSALHSSTTPLQPLVVCGPSGAGKGTIISRFMQNAEEGSSILPKFEFSVSHTTRQPRPGEIDGVHYHFVDRETMEEQIDAGSFIEYANVHGNLYGTSFESLLNISGDKQCLLDIDVEGVRSIKEFQSTQKQQQVMNESSTQQYPLLDSKFIFIAPPSVDVLRERLAGRGTETPETLERRLRNAKTELEYGMEPGNFDAIVVNDDLDQSCEEFESIVKEMYSRRTTI